MVDQKRILIWISSRFSHGRELQQGILAFSRRRADWEIIRGLEPARDSLSGAISHADGVIAFVDHPRWVLALKRFSRPVVNVAWSLARWTGAAVINDDQAIGRLAADYFVQLGYRHLAFVGVTQRPFSSDRQAGFVGQLARRGLDCKVYLRPGRLSASRPGWFVMEKGLREWVAGLSSPTAVFTAADAISVIVATAARKLGRKVPEDLAILGVNNDQLLCESMTPGLSSIRPALQQVGYQAAALLADLLSRRPCSDLPIRIPPMGVVTRASTNMLAVDDPVVVRAMEFIRRRVDQPTTVEDVLDQLVVSRKSLERKFAHYLGRTPLEEIRQVHISRVKELLSDTDCDMRQIARLSGFVRPEHMATVFRSLAGMTPTQWRRQFRHR